MLCEAADIVFAFEFEIASVLRNDDVVRICTDDTNRANFDMKS